METEVKAFMTGQPLSIEPDASAIAALDLMIDHAIRHLPVVDGAHRVCGVISFDDLRAALPVPISRTIPLGAHERRRIPDVAVGEVMTYAPSTVHYDAPLEQVAQKMVEGRFGCLPVVDDDGRLDGIITTMDLLQVLVTVLWSERRSEPNAEPASPVVDLSDVLAQERDHLAAQLEAYEQRVMDQTETRRETPMDAAEQGSGLEEGYLTEQLAELAARRLHALEHALERHGRGELGICEGCGEAIAEGRLRALPSATLCIRCERAAEAARE